MCHSVQDCLHPSSRLVERREPFPHNQRQNNAESQPVEVCLIEFQDRKQSVTATTVEVKFAKACEKQMVTVCQPQPSYGSPTSPYSYHSIQHCKEVGQETCYNIPTLESKQIQVEITLPEPVQKCQTRWCMIQSEITLTMMLPGQ